MSWWDAIIDYYKTIGERYSVNPGLFVGIHIVATPLFILATAWIVHNYRLKKSITIPVVVAIFIFNAANIYLITAGKNIPWWIYTIVAITTIISGYFSFKKIRKKMEH